MIFIYILLGVVLTQYQNCAPSAQVLEQEVGLPVTGIDRVNLGAISFPQQKVQAYQQDALSVSGVCDQSGALISWQLRDSLGQLIERGLAECELGVFTVELSDDWKGYCGDDLELQAFLGAKASSQTQVEPICP